MLEMAAASLVLCIRCSFFVSSSDHLLLGFDEDGLGWVAIGLGGSGLGAGIASLAWDAQPAHLTHLITLSFLAHLA